MTVTLTEEDARLCFAALFEAEAAWVAQADDAEDEIEEDRFEALARAACELQHRMGALLDATADAEETEGEQP